MPVNEKLIIEDLKRGGELLIFIRPNDIQLLDLDDERAKDNAFEGLIESTTYLGDKVDYRIRSGNNLELRVQARGMSGYTRGDRVKVHLPVDRVKAIASD